MEAVLSAQMTRFLFVSPVRHASAYSLILVYKSCQTVITRPMDRHSGTS